MQTWPYADYGWWTYAIHAACSQHGWSPCALHSAAELNACPPVEALSAFYSDTLQLLRSRDVEYKDARRLLFLAKALKKWRLSDPSDARVRKDKAIRGFVARNREAQSAGPIPTLYASRMKRILAHWLPDPEAIGADTTFCTGVGDPIFPTDGISWVGKFGPGKVAERLTHLRRFEVLSEWVYQQPLRTAGYVPYKDVNAVDSHWLSDHWPEVPLTGGYADHVTARLCAVPKEATKDRLITVEPTYGSFVQAYARQALQTSIHYGPLCGTCMDLGWVDGQKIQRRLALKASRTGRLATLDLSDASDRITYDQVFQVFPAWALSLLDVTRSSSFMCQDYEDLLEPQTMHIYAGMGNGTTFTVETLFFAAFVVAFAEAHRLGEPEVSVFGDDIICTSKVAKALIELGDVFPFFRINHQKSFYGADYLRESCGIFAYKGEDITVPKVDGYPNTWEGRLALCDLHSRLIADDAAFAQRLSFLMADVGVLVNWDRKYPGYPSIDDPRVERSVAPPTRFNKLTHCVEAKLPVKEARQRRFATSTALACRNNTPRPETLLLARLAGLIPPTEARVDSPERRRPSAFLSLPDEGSKGKVKRRWVPAM